MEDQIIEVEYDKDLVEKYKENYIMEEEGTGSFEEVEPSDTQNNVNEASFEDMNEEGEVILEEVIEDDKN